MQGLPSDRITHPAEPLLLFVLAVADPLNGLPVDKRFEGLMITQLVLEDGWAGLAVGPTAESRVAERSRSLK